MPSQTRLSIRHRPIVVRPEDRVAIFGRTGTGKTTLVKTILWQAPRYVVLDPKHRFTLGAVPIVTSFRSKLPRQIIRVPVDVGEAGWIDAIDATFWRGDCVLYSDETTEFTSRNRIIAPLKRAIVQGREVGVGVWCASQRPSDIHSVVFTEAEHIFAFQLNFQADIQKIARFTHERVVGAIERLHGHNYVYFDVLGNRIVHVRAADLSEV